MTSNSSFIRKVAYIVAIAVLLIPLSIMSRPATAKRGEAGIERQPGGTLATMRDQAGLSQAQLGEIDPASETMKLATFGMRGVAVVLLWDRANEFKKKEDWDNLSATLEQIARLQPNFVTVWEHQAHNLSYNVSVEFDDYKQRYHWVKKGIDYLIDGTVFNRNEPRLLWYAGWVVGQKIGRSDERVQFRRMFKDDTEFHTMLARELQIDRELSVAKGPDGKPDNWLVGREWYLRAIQANNAGASIGGKSPALFHSSPIMSRINSAADLEKEPGFDEERVRAEWGRAGEEWQVLGNRPIPTSGGFMIQLNQAEELQAEIAQLKKDLATMLPGVEEDIRKERLDAMKADVRRAYEKPPEERNATEQSKAYEAEQQLQIHPLEIASRAPSDKTIEANRLAQRILSTEERLRYTNTSRQVINFEFWRDKCAASSTEMNTKARRLLFEAKAAFAKPDLEEAKEKFEASFAEWAKIFEKWPTQKGDAENEELAADVETYIKVLEQLDLRDESGAVLPADFPLPDLLREFGREGLLKFREPEKKDEKEPSTSEEEKKSSETPPAAENN